MSAAIHTGLTTMSLPALVLVASMVPAADWERLPSLPDKEGFAGSFAGVSGDALLVGGGANFPDKKPWEGGTKRWTDAVFVLEKPSGEWKVAGKLPRPLGYGVSVTHGGAVVCAGGSDAERHYANVFKFEWRAGKLVTTDLPPLPKTLANTSGALVGDVLYVVGGIEKPDSAATESGAWALDLVAPEPKWKALPACPGGGCMLALAAGFGGAFYVAGGTDLVTANGKTERRYRTDAYRYDPAGGWTRVADLPVALVGTPSPAPIDASGFYALGGDDGSQVGVAPDKHRGFRTAVLHYDPKRDTWTEVGALAAPRVTAPCVRWAEWWVVPSGEVRPGVRAPEVWRATSFAKR